MFFNEALTLERLVEFYKSKSLLAHESHVLEMALKVQSCPSEISGDEIQRNLALLFVWPLIERYRICNSVTGAHMNQDQRKRVDILHQKFVTLQQEGDSSRECYP